MTKTVETKISVTLEMTMTLAEAWALRDYLADHDIKAKTIEKCHVVEEDKSAPKAETKPAPKKTGKKTAKKSSDNFDRDEYEALSKYFMVYGKHGCYRFARKTIYGIMGKGYVVDGKVVITKRTRNSILKTLTSEAEKCGEAWATGKVAEIKKAMAQALVQGGVASPPLLRKVEYYHGLNTKG